MSDRKLLEKIADGLAHGEYSLLAGAGASLGAIGGDGRALPSGPELRDALIKDFDIDTGGESISLARAYDHLSRRAGPASASTSRAGSRDADLLGRDCWPNSTGIESGH